MKTWIAWLEALIQRHDGRVRDLAIAAGIAENKISRWRYGALLPSPGDQIKLAKVSGSALETIMKMVWDADHERDQEREARHRPLPPTGGARHGSQPRESHPNTPAVGVPPRPRPDSASYKGARRRKVGVLVGAGLGLGALLGGPVIVQATPVGPPSNYASYLKDYVSSRRRQAA